MSSFNEKSARDFTPASASERKGMLDIFPTAPEPPTELARYRILSPTCGLRVSPICLGAMSIGDQWTGFMGGKGMGAEESEKYLDEYYNMGGNFIDTANNYQDEQSEMIVGEWIEKRGIRSEIVLATKFTTPYLWRKDAKFPGIHVNHGGNHKKSLRNSLEDSLRKLRTDYVDILYVHWWDHSTSIPELMQSLNEVVRCGKVLYLGISDTPAWVVSEANQYARDHGLAQFVLYQGLWNLSVRDMERDIIPMCRHNGMAIAPWGVLGQGKFKHPDEIKDREHLRGKAETEKELQAVKALEEVTSELGGKISLANVAMIWARQKMTDCYPILGGTSIQHLKENVEALRVHLTPEQMQKLSDAAPFDHGFPTGRFGRDPRDLAGGKPDSVLLNAAGHIQFKTWE